MIGEAIRKRREELGLTQIALAARAGIPQSHVSRLECGRLIPKSWTIKKLANALDLDRFDIEPQSLKRRAVELAAQLSALKKQGKAILAEREHAVDKVEFLEEKVGRLLGTIERLERENDEQSECLKRCRNLRRKMLLKIRDLKKPK